MESQEQSCSMLAALVRRYRVCWEVWPEDIVAEGKVRQVGFELELSGTPEGGTDQFAPGSQACRQVYNALHGVADWILPKEQRPSMYEVGPYAQALRYSAVRSDRPDVTLSVKILHRSGFDRPVDACEVRCLEEMKQRLTQLGACQRRWSSPRAS
jgi:hypothetical protein